MQDGGNASWRPLWKLRSNFQYRFFTFTTIRYFAQKYLRKHKSGDQTGILYKMTYFLVRSNSRQGIHGFHRGRKPIRTNAIFTVGRMV